MFTKSRLVVVPALALALLAGPGVHALTAQQLECTTTEKTTTTTETTVTTGPDGSQTVEAKVVKIETVTTKTCTPR